MLTGGHNDALESVAPSITSTAFDPFVRLILRSIATGLGISYELLARDFTKTNFSSSRSAHLEDRRQWEPEQEEFKNEILRIVWRWFVEDARMRGVFPFAQRKVIPVTWTPQGWLWIDPVKEASATESAIGMGLDNPFDASRRLGRDFGDNLKKKALAERMAEEAGTTINTGGNPTGVKPDVDDEDKTPEEEEGEDGDEDDDDAGANGPRRVAV